MTTYQKPDGTKLYKFMFDIKNRIWLQKKADENRRALSAELNILVENARMEEEKK